MDIILDFDGTCTTHDFPEIGKEIGSVPVLKKIVEKGHNLILFTMRSDEQIFLNKGVGESRKVLFEAVLWFKKHNIPLYGIQRNPTQDSWTTSPKAYGQLHIDDAGLGIPLKTDPKLSNRPFVDWLKVEEMLIEKGII